MTDQQREQQYPNTGFLTRVESEVQRARAKFPGPNANLAALTEEVGELAKAMLSEDFRAVYDESIQVAAMAMRCAEEGDPTLNPYREGLGLRPFAPMTDQGPDAKDQN